MKSIYSAVLTKPKTFDMYSYKEMVFICNIIICVPKEGKGGIRREQLLLFTKIYTTSFLSLLIHSVIEP